MNTEPFSNMIESKNYNCYEFYLAATEKYGDYKQAQHMDQMVMRSKFICDTEALACYFKKDLGLKRGDVYSIFVPSDIESFTAFYALNKLGVIVNFIHPLLPDEALIETVKESGSKGIMVLGLLGLKQHNVDAVNSLGLPVLLCRCSDYAAPAKKKAAAMGEALLEKILGYKNATLYEEVVRKYEGRTVEGCVNNCDDIAVYLNGGGTTGKSKTIKLTNKAINENVHKLGYIDHIEDPGEEAEIIILPFFHAFGLVVAGHMALCNAGRIIPLMQFDAKLVLKLYKKNKVVGIGGIPNMFKKLYNTPGFDGPHLKDTRMMFVGGDDLSPAFLEAFNGMLEKNGTSARLRQGYGLTEVGSVCCVNTNWVYKDGSIGKPLEGLRMEIWDDDHKEVPVGEVGEICISGSTLMEGYLTEDGPKDAGLYYDEEGTAWVLSGDLGYMDEDGFFYFYGRKKRVIIISGYNVYPVDIENLMDTLPFIKESCAVRGTTEDGRPLVRLYVSLKTKGDEEEYKKIITDACAKNLNQFSVPREIIFMDELPHTPLEKVDFMKLEKM
ncbi:MAG: long-chain fatty acid--CoA ligase [Ruminococcaceae bacterium]|nr:long-chain fatty acid--CoA ligase [Oscillospiraceae bacterium]MBR3596717.1 AMP-binding protein [Clostridia bacterium]